MEIIDELYYLHPALLDKIENLYSRCTGWKDRIQKSEINREFSIYFLFIIACLRFVSKY